AAITAGRNTSETSLGPSYRARAGWGKRPPQPRSLFTDAPARGKLPFGPAGRVGSGAALRERPSPFAGDWWIFTYCLPLPFKVVMADPGQTAVAREIHRIASHPIPRRAGSATPQPWTAG